MNTARIVVPTVAIAAGGIATYLASGSDDNKPAPAEPVERLPTLDMLVARTDIGPGQTEAPARARQNGTLSLALRSIVNANAKDGSTQDQALRRCDSAVNRSRRRSEPDNGTKMMMRHPT